MDEQFNSAHLEHIDEFKSTLPAGALEAALEEIQGRSFSGRNPELGKMIKCQVCGLRHRERERKCEQKFTHTYGGRENGGANQYRKYREVEDQNGEVSVEPDYRTALRPGERPTVRQQLGAAYFHKKRFHPHPSKIKLKFIERVRTVFYELGFTLPDDYSSEEEQAQHEKNLMRARVVAARQIRKEFRAARKARLKAGAR
jgi:hypothetical protein